MAPEGATFIKDVDLKLSEIEQLVVSQLPVGQRAVSPNGREFLSRHFIRKGGEFKPADEAIERFFAQVLILGERRPYNLQILVTRERRVLKNDQFTYRVIGHDPRLAKELEKNIRLALTERREDRNIIDDFRVF